MKKIKKTIIFFLVFALLILADCSCSVKEYDSTITANELYNAIKFEEFENIKVAEYTDINEETKFIEELRSVQDFIISKTNNQDEIGIIKTNQEKIDENTDIVKQYILDIPISESKKLSLYNYGDYIIYSVLDEKSGNILKTNVEEVLRKKY